MIRQCLRKSRKRCSIPNKQRSFASSSNKDHFLGRSRSRSRSNQTVTTAHNHNHNNNDNNDSNDNSNNNDKKRTEMNNVMKAFFQNNKDTSSSSRNHLNSNSNSNNKSHQQQRLRLPSPPQPKPQSIDNNHTNTNDSIRAFFQNRSLLHNTLTDQQPKPAQTQHQQQQQQLNNNRGKFPWDLKPLHKKTNSTAATATTTTRDFPSFLDKYKTASTTTTTSTTTTQSKSQPNTPTTSLPRPPPRPGVGLAAPSTPQTFTSPLSEMIRQMQLEQQQKQQQNNNNNNNTGTANTNEPRWRTNTLRSLRNTSRINHHQNTNKINDFLNNNDDNNNNDNDRARQRRRRPRKRQPIQVVLPSYQLSVAETSQLFRQPKRHIERILRQLGAAQVTSLDRELLELVASECSHLQIVEQGEQQQQDNYEEERLHWPTRPPVVTVMGHVDHGKTTLMDALRRRAQGTITSNSSSNNKKGKKGVSTAGGDIAGTEAGGITQVISAFQVALEGTDTAVTFLDTPGHAAFRNMRQSGSEAADVIVLVVAAEDGLAAQSLEIIQFYKSLLEQSVDISLVVAMNKIDQPGINLEECQYRLENQLLQEGILVEGMPQTSGDFLGAPVPLYPISAKEGTGLDDLVEGLVLQSEIMDLRAPTDEAASGILLDARIEKGLGIVVDAIVRSGSLKKGDVVVSGAHKGRVRILKTAQSNAQISEAMSSQPVRIMGFDSLPTAGDLFRVVESEEVAQELVEKEKALKDVNESKPTTVSSAEIQGSGKDTLDKNWQNNLKEKYQIEESDSSIIRIPMVLKASADGTLMALQEALQSLIVTSKYKLQLDVVQMAVGPVSENDMQLASESGAMILGFDVKVPSSNEMEVPVFQSKVIYTLLDNARDAMAQRYLPPTKVEQVHGKADVQAVFSIGGVTTKIAGLRVLQGRLHRHKANGVAIQYRVLGKDKTVKVASGKATSLKHFKQDVDEVSSGQECGLALEGYDQYEDGDIIECFSVTSKYEFS